MEFKSLLDAARSYGKMVAFIESGGLYDAILAVGDHASEAALYALEVKKISNDPRARVQSIITHLELAHVSYRSIWKSRNNILGKSLRSVSLSVARNKDIWVLCLMAVCYRYLNEPETAKKVLIDAQKALQIEGYDWIASDDASEESSAFSLLPEIQMFRFLGTLILHAVNPQELFSMLTLFQSNIPSDLTPNNLRELELLLEDNSPVKNIQK